MSEYSPPVIIYQKMAGRYSKWWCKSHKREADYILLKRSESRVVCNPNLGGIMLPCNCEKTNG